MFSLILRPPLDGDAVSLLTTAVGLACAEAVEAITGLHTGLKWPNDVTSGGRKLAGLLVESATRGDRVETAIAGCGLNVHLPPGMPTEVAAGAMGISDALEPGTTIDRAGLLAGILATFEVHYVRLYDPAGRNEVLRRAEERSDVLGRVVTARTADGSSVSGIARRLLPSGALELEVGGAPHALHSAEITQLRSAPRPS